MNINLTNSVNSNTILDQKRHNSKKDNRHHLKNQHFKNGIKTNVTCFNVFQLNRQQKVISNMLMKEYNDQIRKELLNLKNLLHFMLSLKYIDKTKQYLQLIINEKEQEETMENGRIHFDKIKLTPNAIELFDANNVLNSFDLAEKIEKFQTISIDLDYPSDSFQMLYDKVIKFKEICNYRLHISILIDKIDETDMTFKNDNNINSVIIGSSVKRISGEEYLPFSEYSGGSFRGCTQLSEILIPITVTTIGEGAFCGCSSLTQITIPNLKSIESDVFNNCTSLKRIVIPSSVEIIKESAFSGCISLEEVIIQNSPNEKSFLSSIEKYAFSRCESLKKLILPPSVNNIGEKCFIGCKSLIKIIFENDEKDHPLSASFDVDNLLKLSSTSKSISIKVLSSQARELITIGEGSFVGCPLLENISIIPTNKMN